MGAIWKRIRYGRPPRVEPESPGAPRVPKPPPKPPVASGTGTIKLRSMHLISSQTSYANVVQAGLANVGEMAGTVDFQVFSDALGDIAGAAADAVAEITDS